MLLQRSKKGNDKLSSPFFFVCLQGSGKGDGNKAAITFVFFLLQRSKEGDSRLSSPSSCCVATTQQKRQ